MKKFLIVLFLPLILLFNACTTDKEIVYSSVYPSLPPIESPNVVSVKACHWEYPIVQDEKVFIGLDETNFKCYLSNKEKEREQRLLYENLIKEINKERQAWNLLNEENSKKVIDNSSK